MPEPIIIGNATMLQGDCLAVMPTLAADSLDAIVTDPPYGLSFMGQNWDHGIPGTAFWVEALRVAKPGAHLLAFGGSRTFHRLVCAIEDAGWEVRDVLMWVYGSGFPKSLDVSKALDKREGAEREVIGRYQPPNGTAWNLANDKRGGNLGAPTGIRSESMDITAPATDAARQWAGWGTALKPAYEPILLARKPLAGTVAANVLDHGCGVLNIDGCRVATVGKRPHIVNDRRNGNNVYQNGLQGSREIEPTTLGRFPANLIHDGSPEVVALFPETWSGGNTGRAKSAGKGSIFGSGEGLIPDGKKVPHGYGSAARFFYTAKASQDDRDDNNHHPTVKPTSLMRYLCRLITPPDGLILDPFTGSGSTGKAAMLEGFRFVGIEQDPEYLVIAAARVRAAHEQPKQMELLADLPAPAPFIPRQAPSAQQVQLFEAA